MSVKNVFMIYPNPVTSWVKIDKGGEFASATDLTLEVTSEGGGRLISFDGIASLNDLTDIFNKNLDKLEPGMYFAKIKAQNKNYIQKFIKK